jgi:hypothetical protein
VEGRTAAGGKPWDRTSAFLRSVLRSWHGMPLTFSEERERRRLGDRGKKRKRKSVGGPREGWRELALSSLVPFVEVWHLPGRRCVVRELREMWIDIKSMILFFEIIRGILQIGKLSSWYSRRVRNFCSPVSLQRRIEKLRRAESDAQKLV